MGEGVEKLVELAAALKRGDYGAWDDDWLIGKFADAAYHAVAAEAQVEAMRKALEPFAAMAGTTIRFTATDSTRVYIDTEHFNAALAALASSTPERSLEVSVDESAASLASELTDQQRSTPLDERAQWRLSRFAEGEHAKTVYALPHGGSYDPLRRDISALLAAVTVKAEESAVYPAGFAALAEEFAKPQFMTTTSGIGLHTLQFSFHGEGARERRDALHDAIRTAAKAVNS